MIEMQKRERMIIWEGDAGLWDNEAYLKFCAQEGNPIVEAFTGKKKKKNPKTGLRENTSALISNRQAWQPRLFWNLEDD